MQDRRKSGVLMHIVSLPSPYGIGDMGPEAFAFADFLHETRQSYWQILPLNPTDSKYGNSPYSSTSAFAMNPLLISPEMLIRDNLLTSRDIRRFKVSSKNRVNYNIVSQYNDKALSKAYVHFTSKSNVKNDFSKFYDENAFWLDDYTLFKALKTKYNGEKWSGWPPHIRDREKTALSQAAQELKEEIELEKFIQYQCFKQWSRLKSYCNEKHIKIVGDIPLYVNYDSADVWSHPDIFELDSEKNLMVVSGVPPDYYSDTGQLWNNPIYNWRELKKQDYSWWIQRFNYNLKLFDRLRLDHFRGFAGYWEVPAGESTAVNGRWKKGPGNSLFSTLKKHTPSMPFIAEDLGYITEYVVKLRDSFSLPGMRVLQFGFGKEESSKQHLPHNFIKNSVAYTGTHDNNTMKGWLREKPQNFIRSRRASDKEQIQALRYIGKRRINWGMIHWEFIRLLMTSCADTTIVPIQDILGLGAKSRMNIPGIQEGNWEWRMKRGALKKSTKKKLLNMTVISGRE